MTWPKKLKKKVGNKLSIFQRQPVTGRLPSRPSSSEGSPSISSGSIAPRFVDAREQIRAEEREKRRKARERERKKQEREARKRRRKQRQDRQATFSSD